MIKFRIIVTINYSLLIIASFQASAQLKWQNVDTLYQPLPSSVHIYFTKQAVDSTSFRAYYLIADLKDKQLHFTVDTTRDRRLIPSKFYERNDRPLLIVNCTFFSFKTNRSLNTVIKNGKLLAYNVHTIPGKGKDTLTYKHTFGSAIGVSEKRNADVAWTLTRPAGKKAYANQWPVYWKDSLEKLSPDSIEFYASFNLGHAGTKSKLHKWKMQTAVGGGPVLLQNGEIEISNNEELKFAGKAINDKHPRTAMGYTQDDKLIILVIEGRNENAGGATLTLEAQILKDLGCWEALNLDGGGSSCMLVNGKETIRVSDAAGQRPVPAVFIIKQK